MFSSITFFVVVVLFYALPATTAMSHQFHFSGGNMAYGLTPQRVHISGSWYIHPNDTNFRYLLTAGYTDRQLMGDNLYVCRKDVEKKLILINDAANRKRKQMIDSLLSSSLSNTSVITPFINTDGCDQLVLSDHVIRSQHKGRKSLIVKTFNIHHNFTDYSPVLFVDPYGVAAFLFREKHSDSRKLKYCENDETSFPVIFSQRPICPRPALRSTVVEDGVVTIYKPNIESVQKTAYHCYIETYHIETFDTGFGWENNLPVQPVVTQLKSHAACAKWIETQKCVLSDLGIKEESNYNRTIIPISPQRNATKNELVIKYTLWRSNRYHINNCIIDIGYIRTTPPFKTMFTPWGRVPVNRLYMDNYKQAGGEVIVWEKFEKEEVCNFVPMTSFDAKRITYNSRDFLEQDPHPGATEMYHFVSDAEKSVYTSDNTQVLDLDEVDHHCIVVDEENGDDETEKVYAINNGMLLQWKKGKRLVTDEDDEDDYSYLREEYDEGQTLYHPHYAYNDITVIKNENETDTEINTVAGGSKGDGGDKEECAGDDDDHSENPYCRKTYIARNESEISNAAFVRKKEQIKKPVLNETEKTTPLFAMVNYLNYKFREYTNQEVIRRAQAWCENQQHLYDIQVMLARLSPSVILSSHMNRPVEAKSIGAGVYNTHYCNIVEDFMVVENLFINNDDVAPKMNGMTYKQLYQKAKVQLRKNYCFSMPIIIFKERASQMQSYRIGQLNHDQSISTIAMRWIEECKFDRYFFHVIGSEVHVFHNYLRISKTPLDVLFDHYARIRDNSKYVKDIEGGATPHRGPIEPLLEQTQFVDVHTQYEPQQMKPIELGFKNTELYDYRQQRRTVLNYEEAIMWINGFIFSATKWDQMIVGNKTVISEGLDINIDLDDVFDGLKVIGEGIFDIAEKAYDGVTGFVSGVIGTGINAIGGIFGSIAGFFKGGLMEILIIVAAFAVAGLFIYYFVKNKLLADDSGGNRGYQQPQPLYLPAPQQQPSYSESSYGTGREERVRERRINQDEFVTDF